MDTVGSIVNSPCVDVLRSNTPALASRKIFQWKLGGGCTPSVFWSMLLVLISTAGIVYSNPYVYMPYAVYMDTYLHENDLENLAIKLHNSKRQLIVWYRTDDHEKSVLLEVDSVNINGQCIQFNVVDTE